MSEEQAQEQRPVDVYEVFTMILGQLAEIAWTKLGLRPDLATRRIEKDLEQARVTIDVIVQLARVLEAKLDDEDKRQVRNLVSDLKMNFVTQSQA
ncbi:MAG: DUF1844 domain-containing protein [Fimbriimonadaceae bacterium]|nr:DUF1844 domain-containing protein [Fimbriimonadaceae bacterium]